MQYMQFTTVFFSQRDRFRGRFITSFNGSYMRMLRDWNVAFRVSLARLCQISFNGWVVFAMGCNEYWALGKNLLQSLGIIHKHVASRRAHKNLYTAGFTSLQLFNFVNISVTCTQIKSIICIGFSCS